MKNCVHQYHDDVHIFSEQRKQVQTNMAIIISTFFYQLTSVSNLDTSIICNQINFIQNSHIVNWKHWRLIRKYRITCKINEE